MNQTVENSEKISDIIRLLNEAKKIGLITHKNSDGDAYGSLLALKRVLDQSGKKTIIFSNEALIPSFEYLNGEINYQPVKEFEPVDLLIGFDGNFIDRFTIPEAVEKAKSSSAKIVVVDHHLKGNIGETAEVYWYDEHASSTSEMILTLLKDMGSNIDKITATLILLGIELDTNSLQFSNATPDSFEAVSELLKMGARLKPVVENAFGNRSLSSLKLLGRVVERLELDEKTGWATSYITKKDNEELGLTEGSASGIVNFMEQAEGVRIVAVFEERDGKVKASVRSNNSAAVDAVTIAKHFGGGGHVKAAGYEISGTLTEAITAFEDFKKSKVIDTKQ